METTHHCNWNINSDETEAEASFCYNGFESSKAYYQEDSNSYKQGIVCNGDKRVTKIKLCYAALQGNIEAPVFQDMDYLETIWIMSNDKLTGDLSISGLPNLENILARKNGFTKFSPYDVKSIKGLRNLDLSENFLETFNLENFTYPELTWLDLKDNVLSLDKINGLFDGNFATLTELELDENKLGGKLDSHLFQRGLPLLEVLSLQRNEFTGRVPSFDHANLKVLELYENEFTGVSTVSWNLPNLNEIYVFGKYGVSFEGVCQDLLLAFNRHNLACSDSITYINGDPHGKVLKLPENITGTEQKELCSETLVIGNTRCAWESCDVDYDRSDWIRDCGWECVRTTVDNSCYVP